MKYLAVLFLVLVTIAICPASASAQRTPVDACQAELMVAHVRTRGKLARVGNTLVFIDEPALGLSFSIDRSNIRRLNEYAGVLSIYTATPVRYHEVVEQHFTFRVTPDCQAVTRWLNRSSFREPIPKKRREGGDIGCPLVARRSFRAEEDVLGRNHKGTLTISSSAIQFFPDNPNDNAYQWFLKDLRDIEPDGRDKLKINSYGLGQVKIKLLSGGFSSATLGTLRKRIRNRCWKH